MHVSYTVVGMRQERLGMWGTGQVGGKAWQDPKNSGN